MANRRLYDFVDPGDTQCVRREIVEIVRDYFPDYNDNLFNRVFSDVEKLFLGMYPGYRASNTKYHDFEHTCSVLLATGRLIYGAMAHGLSFKEHSVTKGLLAALFHDVGLIQTTDDTLGTGAKYTVGHEERSIQFMRENLEDILSEEGIEDIADCIRCTILAMSPGKVLFRSEEIRYMGYFLGSADLLAQIADRCYLEKLLLLFEEFKEANLPGYENAYELLLKTRTFYQDVAKKRLDNDLDKVDRFMMDYFHKRWNVNQNLYDVAINANLDYLDSILTHCEDDIECFLKSLRRGNIVAKLR